MIGKRGYNVFIRFEEWVNEEKLSEICKLVNDAAYKREICSHLKKKEKTNAFCSKIKNRSVSFTNY